MYHMAVAVQILSTPTRLFFLEISGKRASKKPIYTGFFIDGSIYYRNDIVHRFVSEKA